MTRCTGLHLPDAANCFEELLSFTVAQKGAVVVKETERSTWKSSNQQSYLRIKSLTEGQEC